MEVARVFEPKRTKAADTVEKERAAPSYVIDIVNVSKSFKRFSAVRSGYTTLKSAALGLFLPRKTDETVVQPVLNDLTLRIPKGSSCGIIGRNGSGKSTLLKLITGIYKPDSGSIQVQGRVAALIELGAGFHPDFSGRENLYLAGVMHGLTKEQIDERFEEIVHFAELEHVIDEPVRTYSSGMFMRLGFSLAVHTDPDVLLVDEVLAVGDAAFVSKCQERIAELRREGKTLLLVTHDLDAVERWCDDALWLNDGEVAERGKPRRVIDAYRHFVERGEEIEFMHEQLEHERSQSDELPASDQEEHEERPTRWGSREIEIERTRLLNSERVAHLLFHTEDEVLVEMQYQVHEPVSDVVFGIGLHRTDGLAVHGSNTEIERIQVPELGRSGSVIYRIKRLGLLEGNYRLDVAVHRLDGYPFDYHEGVLQFAVRSPIKQLGVIVPEHSWEFQIGDARAKGIGGRE